MQMFRTQAREGAAIATRFDNETVREVLARASQIDAESVEQEPLTAAQVEALGNDLGISPLAVRRAMGERVGPATESSVLTRAGNKQTVIPLTQEQVKSANKATLWYTLLCLPTIFGLSRAMQSGTTPSELGGAIAIVIALVAPIFLAFRWGFLTKRAGVGAVGGFLTVLLISSAAFLAGSMAGDVIHMGVVAIILAGVSTLGGVAGAAGAWTRQWWDSLPRNSDR